MATFRDLLASAKSQITEVTPAEAEERIARGGVVVLDVREPDEYEQGAIDEAVHIPRGFLESRIEAAAPDKSRRIVLSCASGARFVHVSTDQRAIRRDDLEGDFCRKCHQQNPYWAAFIVFAFSTASSIVPTM